MTSWKLPHGLEPENLSLNEFEGFECVLVGSKFNDEYHVLFCFKASNSDIAIPAAIDRFEYRIS